MEPFTGFCDKLKDYDDVSCNSNSTQRMVLYEYFNSILVIRLFGAFLYEIHAKDYYVTSYKHSAVHMALGSKSFIAFFNSILREIRSLYCIVYKSSLQILSGNNLNS